jgi:glutathione S-transferase
MAILLYDLVGADAGRPFSPHCWKVAMALAHKGLPFTSMPSPFTRIPTIEDGATKIVPLIRDGDTLVSDSFEIALYLEDAYPDRPSLFCGEGGKAMARFVERWSQLTIHSYLGAAILMEIHDCLAPEDKAHFRRTREPRFGKTIEEVPLDRDARLAGFRASLEPLRSMLTYQPFIGGASPLFADYIVFGAFQFARVVSSYQTLAADDPVRDWFERCLALHDGLGARVTAAA